MGIGLLSGILKQLGHQVKGIYVHEKLTQQTLTELVSSVRAFNPGLIGYSCTSPAFESIKTIAAHIRRALAIPSICGGAHPTLYPEETLLCSGIDYICIGEGERALPEFVGALEKGRRPIKVPGISYLDSECRMVNSHLYPLEQNLDGFAWTDYDLLGEAYIQKETSDGWLRSLSSRGCPYSCSYCHTPMFRKVYADRIGVSQGKLGYVRFRGIAPLMAELKQMIHRYDLKVINFMDDLFCVNKERTLEFCNAFKEHIPKKVGYSIQTHLAHLDEDIVSALRQSRCLRVVVGVESGSQRVLDLFKRPTTPVAMARKLKLLVDAKFPLGTWTLNMLGNPQETYEEMMETISLNARSLVEKVKINFLAPYPQSQIYEYCTKHDLFAKETGTQRFKDRKISTLKFPEKETAFLEKFFDIGHWYMNALSPLALDSLYRPLIEAVETIGFGEWDKKKDSFLEKDKQISEQLEKKRQPFYQFTLKGKVYSNVIGLNTFPLSAVTREKS